MTDAGLTVLHAEGVDADAAAVRRALESLGHRVLRADAVARAAALFEHARPQLMIVDAALDGDRGLTFVAQARGSPHGAWVPVLVTGRGGPTHDALRAAVDAGADDWLAKPFDPALLALRVRALQRIAAVHSGLQAIIDNVLEAIIVIDGRGLVRSFNAAAEQVFGYAADEVIGRNVSLLMPSPYREQHDAYIAAYLRTREPRIIGVGRQVSARRKSGEVFPVSLAVSAVRGAQEDTFIGLVHDLSAEHEREHLAHLALHDALTGLPNRAHFAAALEDAVRRAGAPGQAFALLFVDVDRFKRINDQLGHAVGDAVLSTIAGRLKHSVSRQDLVARLAGDEFVVLLRGVGERSAAEAVAARLRDAVAATMVFGDRALHVQVSIGVALAGADGRDAAALLAAADRAMYRAKPPAAAPAARR